MDDDVWAEHPILFMPQVQAVDRVRRHRMSTVANRAYRGLDTVLVSKTSLLNTLKTNRDTHVTEYKEALDTYKTKVVDILKKAVEEHQALLDRASQPGYKFEHSDLPRVLVEAAPQSHEEDYDMAITKLEMSLDNEIELDDDEFRQFVMDNWAWKQQFKAQSMALNAYANTRSSK